jgi:phosphate starvation-inducible protein PhoH
MSLRSIPRFALDQYLRAVKWPLDRAAGMLGARTSVDRADATVRGLAGAALGDPELQQDAVRRHVATDERERAQRLRDTAEQISERSDAELQERERQAEVRKETAARGATQRKQRAAQAESRRKAANAKAEARAEEAVEKRAKRERLRTLEEKSAAVEKADDAVTARDEAQRLAGAAARAKSARKSG